MGKSKDLATLKDSGLSIDGDTNDYKLYRYKPYFKFL